MHENDLHLSAPTKYHLTFNPKFKSSWNPTLQCIGLVPLLYELSFNFHKQT